MGVKQLAQFIACFGCAPSFNKSRCKKLLRTTMSRIKLLKRKREVQVRQARQDVAQLMRIGGEKCQKSLPTRLDIAWKEDSLLSIYVKIAEYCQLVKANLSNIAGQRECPIDLREPIASLCYAAACCGDLPELQELREIFSIKYGRNFIAPAQDVLHNDSHVNRSILKRLSSNVSDAEKQGLLKDIIAEYEVKCIDQTSIPKTAVLLKSGGQHGVNQCQQDNVTHTCREHAVGTNNAKGTDVVPSSFRHGGQASTGHYGPMSEELSRGNRNANKLKAAKKKAGSKKKSLLMHGHGNGGITGNHIPQMQETNHPFKNGIHGNVKVYADSKKRSLLLHGNSNGGTTGDIPRMQESSHPLHHGTYGDGKVHADAKAEISHDANSRANGNFEAAHVGIRLGKIVQPPYPQMQEPSHTFKRGMNADSKVHAVSKVHMDNKMGTYGDANGKGNGSFEAVCTGARLGKDLPAAYSSQPQRRPPPPPYKA